ncbi:hypothetical protein HRI_001620300 [Hibiscus trionum]|uniref:Uncharacterized protein n=1 Tax=Hibiscus trionum TaxID=183268 RepID=A0A9W7HPB0_HIBTR|nr:hypothetical protein HRI_001620300 [Hibiscus trionum]
MCASIKFLAMLIFLIAFGITRVSIVFANRDSIETLLGKKASPSPSYVALFSWSDVRAYIAPCKGFFIGMAPDPSPSCCAGAKTLAELTKTKRDEQELCTWLKVILPLHGDYDPLRLPLLGEKCHINFYFPPVTSDINCSK